MCSARDDLPKVVQNFSRQVMIKSKLAGKPGLREELHDLLTPLQELLVFHQIDWKCQGWRVHPTTQNEEFAKLHFEFVCQDDKHLVRDPLTIYYLKEFVT